MTRFNGLCAALWLSTGLAALPALATPVPALQAGDDARLPAGDGSFVFSDWHGPAITVFTHLPQKVTAATPIVFVMHGTNRDPERYRREWSALADRDGFILVTPGFDKDKFPHTADYNYGGFRTTEGTLRPRAQWTFAAIEPMFDAVKARTGSRVGRYAIYGHSAGAQFVHRYVLLARAPRIGVAISANAGSYTMPVFDVDYPFGLRGAPVSGAQLKQALAMPLVVLLGTADIDPNGHALPKQPEAIAQGPYRLARGQTFFETAQVAAKRLNAPFRWRLAYAPGIGHSDAGMANFAAALMQPGAQPSR